MTVLNNNNKEIHHPEEFNRIASQIGKEYLSEKNKEEMINTLNPKSMILLVCVSAIHIGFDISDFNELRLTKEYKDVKRNLKVARKRKNFSKWLFKKQSDKLTQLKNVYTIKKIKTIYEILGKSWEGFKYLTKKDKQKAEKLFNTAYNKTKKDLKEKYDAIDSDLIMISNGLSRNFLIDELLGVENSDKDFLDYLAFYILKPEHQLSSYFIVHPFWKNFPLKWYIHYQTTDEGKYLLKKFSRGEDLSDYLVKKYEFSDFEEIRIFLNDPYLSVFMEHKGESILEILKIYRNDSFSSIFISLFPLIESFIWDLTLVIHDNVTALYSDNTLKLLMNKKGLSIEKNIGNLLKNTKFDQFVDDKFIEYFCNEFYLERNPYLHGQIQPKNSKKEVIKKIATLEYVLHLSRNIIRNELYKKFDEKKDTLLLL